MINELKNNPIDKQEYEMIFDRLCQTPVIHSERIEGYLENKLKDMITKLWWEKKFKEYSEQYPEVALVYKKLCEVRDDA